MKKIQGCPTRLQACIFWTWAFTRIVPLKRKNTGLVPGQGCLLEELLWKYECLHKIAYSYKWDFPKKFCLFWLQIIQWSLCISKWQNMYLCNEPAYPKQEGLQCCFWQFCTTNLTLKLLPLLEFVHCSQWAHQLLAVARHKTTWKGMPCQDLSGRTVITTLIAQRRNREGITLTLGRWKLKTCGTVL